MARFSDYLEAYKELYPEIKVTPQRVAETPTKSTEPETAPVIDEVVTTPPAETIETDPEPIIEESKQNEEIVL